MNSTECTRVQGLIADLDDTRLLYATLAPLLIRPHLKFLIEKVANSHATIAYHLAWQMDRAGGLTAHRGASLLARLNARLERWIALTNIDVELGCLKRIARHEARLTQRFREALGSIRDLHQNLHRELGQLERTLFRIESLVHEMEMPASAPPQRRAAIIPLSQGALPVINHARNGATRRGGISRLDR